MVTSLMPPRSNTLIWVLVLWEYLLCVLMHVFVEKSRALDACLLLHFYPWLSWITKHAATALLMALSRTGSESAAKLEETFLYTLLIARVMDCVECKLPLAYCPQRASCKTSQLLVVVPWTHWYQWLLFGVQCLAFMSCVACTFAGHLGWYTQRHVILVGHEKRKWTWHKTVLKWIAVASLWHFILNGHLQKGLKELPRAIFWQAALLIQTFWKVQAVQHTRC